MPFTSPIFGYHAQTHGPRPHQLPDARSDVKGRTLLRRIRSGYTVISPMRTYSSSSSTSTPPPPPTEQVVPSTQEEVDILTADDDIQSEERAVTPPSYQQTTASDPPPYVPPPPASASLLLPPALPGYTPLPLPPTADDESVRRDLKLPEARRNFYRDVLRRRLASTRKRFSTSSSSDTDSVTRLDEEDADNDSASEAGVVLYRDGDQWVGTSSRGNNGYGAMSKKEQLAVVPRQRGFKAWCKRMWRGLIDFMDEHPYLYILAVFVIVVIVMCLLI